MALTLPTSIVSLLHPAGSIATELLRTARWLYQTTSCMVQRAAALAEAALSSRSTLTAQLSPPCILSHNPVPPIHQCLTLLRTVTGLVHWAVWFYLATGCTGRHPVEAEQGMATCSQSTQMERAFPPCTLS